MQRQNGIIQQQINRINAAIGALDGVNNAVPAAMKRTCNFKGRKDPGIAETVLSHITDPGDLVGDAFIGTNSFGIASIAAGCRFKGSELDNYTYAVDKALFTVCDFAKLQEDFDKIKAECMDEIMSLYETSCCGKRNYISKLHFDPEGEEGFSTPEYYNPTKHRDIENNETIIMAAPCPVCGNRRKVFEKVDERKIKECDKLDTSRFPRHHLIDNSRINITSAHNADLYDRNFSKRAQYALLKIQDAILKLPASVERDLLEQCLVASLTLARICQYGSGSEYIYQVMRKQAQEKNVWEIFEDKYNSFVEFKKLYADQQFTDISSDNCDMQLVNVDYREMLGKNKNVFSVLYTDPPYTDQVPYLERSQLYRDWLHAFYDPDDKYVLSDDMLEKEIVVSNAPSRYNKSGMVQYEQDIDEMFGKSYEALKDYGLLVMTLKLGSKKYLSVLAKYIELAKKNGFEYLIRYCIDKNDPTLRKQAAIKNTMANEILIFFIKLPAADRYWYIGDSNMEFEITKHLYNELKGTEDKSLLLSECVNIIQNMLKHSYNVIADDDTIARIRRVISENFYISNTSYVYIDPNQLYLQVEDNTDLFAKLYDTIPVIIRGFDADKGFTLEDLYFEIINKLFNGNSNAVNQLIETSDHEAEIRVLLDNYCEMDDKKKYHIKKVKNIASEDAVDVSSMDAYEFEDLIKKLFEAKGYYDVIRIGGAGDRGIDVMAKKKIDGEEHGFIVQCKRWIGNVSGTPIQRLHSMMIQMAPTINHAICVTTSNYTPDAQKEAKGTGVQLINGYDLIEELDRYFPGKYYHGALQII